MRRFGILLIAIAFIILLSAGCSAKTSVDAAIDSDEARQFADPAVERILRAINTKKYDEFSQDFSVKMSSSLTKAAFDSICTQFEEKIGTYVHDSKVYSKVVGKDGLITVIYTAEYTKEPAKVEVRIVYEEKDGKKLISGLWFDSVNLRKK
ncbi:MAG: DUF3887 domain-containing protein [Bacillota bacterium]